ncbi:MAG: Asp-tRNA(Asn)/Glu-tRNA(Gln) amidotransferase subunit GatC [Minisyncoccia bacterium]
MISNEEVKRLASLVRIELTEKETETFAKDMGDILTYVDAVKTISSAQTTANEFVVKNVLSEDVVRENKSYTKKILENAPNKVGDYIAVKKIIEGKGNK